MNLNNALVIGAMVNPMAGYANEPTLTVLIDDYIKRDPLAVWKRESTLFFYQDETGVTRYLHHPGVLRPTHSHDEDGIPIFETPADRGFGGDAFDVLLHEDVLKWVRLRGPWSSRPGVVNPCLMKHEWFPCFNCITQRPGAGCGINSDLSIRVVRQILRRYCPYWDLKLDEEYKQRGEHCFVLTYREKRKRDLSKPVVEILQEQYDTMCRALRSRR